MKKAIIFIAVILIPGLWAQNPDSNTADNITLRTFIENDNVPLNREVVYHIELQWPGDLSQYKISEIGEPQVINLTMRGSGSSNRVSTDESGRPISIKRITYYFRPLEMGMAYVEGVTIKYEDTASRHEESLISGRLGIKIIDALPEPGKKNLVKIVWIALGLLAVASAGAYFYYRFKQRKQQEAARLAAQKIETIEERYLRLLQETIHFASNNLKDNLFDLTRLITGYLSERYNFPAMNLSTENLLQVIKEKVNDDTFLRLQDFYHRADLVKFAGEAISESEFHRLFDIVELVLDKQKELFAEKEEK